MTVRLFFALWSALSIVPSLVAQGSSCPRQTTESIDGKWDHKLTQPCGGVTYTIGGLSVSTSSQACPQVMTYTPPHEIIVPATNETMIQVDSLAQIHNAFFTCKTDYFLFIPLRSNCVFTHASVGGSVRLMHAIPCPVRANPEL